MLIGLGALTILVVVVPGLPFVANWPDGDLMIHSATTLAGGGVAALAWIRYSQTRQSEPLFQAAAFLALFVGGATSLAVLVLELESQLGFDRSAPGQGPLYQWTIQRLGAALLLLVGTIAATRRLVITERRVAALVVIVPALVVLLAGVAVLAYPEWLPVIVPPDQLALLAQPIDFPDRSLLNVPLLGTQLSVAALYLAAAIGYARLYRHSAGQSAALGYLAAGLAVAAFSQLHYAIVPGNYQGLVTSGDVLRAAFYGLVLLGVGSAARGDLVGLRRANDALIELRAGDARRVALEERSRLAREIHDGLMQDLWLARLTHGRLLQQPDLSTDAKEVATRVDAILEDALAEARQAIVALQPQADGSFDSLLVRFVEDYGDRYGLEVECTVEGGPVQLGGHAQAEVLRICREALNNARKHADATRVRVDLSATDTTLVISVTDNGRGFDPANTRSGGYGMQSMRERADALGAALSVESAPKSGTKVGLTLDPTASAAPPAYSTAPADYTAQPAAYPAEPLSPPEPTT